MKRDGEIGEGAASLHLDKEPRYRRAGTPQAVCPGRPERPSTSAKSRGTGAPRFGGVLAPHLGATFRRPFSAPRFGAFASAPSPQRPSVVDSVLARLRVGLLWWPGSESDFCVGPAPSRTYVVARLRVGREARGQALRSTTVVCGPQKRPSTTVVRGDQKHRKGRLWPLPLASRPAGPSRRHRLGRRRRAAAAALPGEGPRGLVTSQGGSAASRGRLTRSWLTPNLLSRNLLTSNLLTRTAAGIGKLSVLGCFGSDGSASSLYGLGEKSGRRRNGGAGSSCRLGAPGRAGPDKSSGGNGL